MAAGGPGLAPSRPGKVVMNHLASVVAITARGSNSFYAAGMSPGAGTVPRQELRLTGPGNLSAVVRRIRPGLERRETWGASGSCGRLGY